MEVHLGLDSHATVGFTAPFEVERKAFRDAFRPFSFAPVEVGVGQDLLFTGTLVEVTPRVESDARTVAVSCYAKPGVLEDCTLPAHMVPFESAGLSLRQIAERLCAPFGISVVLTAPEGAAFKKINTRRKRGDTEAEPDQRVADFLADMAKQRGLVMTSTPTGELLFQKSVAPGHPVARLEEGKPPLVSVAPTFSPQSYYSEITGFTSAKRGRVGSKWTERNDRLSGGVLRSISFKLDDTEKADAPAAVKAKMGRMFGNMVQYVVNVPTWRDPRGALWQPNTTLTLLAPSAMVYGETELLVRDVYLKQSATECTASLGLVLPGAFSGEAPPRMPWEEP